MTHSPVLDEHVLDLLAGNLDNTDILDVGSGFGSWGYMIRTRSEGSPRMTGLDMWIPYINRICFLKIYDDMICADAKELPFRDDSFDLVLACEILEHLPRGDGPYFLNELERVARGTVIVTTPHGIWTQGPINDNRYERHRSTWLLDDFKKRRYSVRLIDFVRYPRTLKLVDRIRRWIFRLPPASKEIIAWKSFPTN